MYIDLPQTLIVTVQYHIYIIYNTQIFRKGIQLDIIRVTQTLTRV